MAYIFLSVPILDRPEFKMVYSMYQSILSCKEHRVRLFVNENDSLISRVRNVHMSMFLNEFKDCDYFISLDSDLEVVNCYNTNNIFNKLVSHDKDFVGGLYALKQFNNPPTSASIPMDSSISRTEMPFDKGLLPMRWLSAGCWCLKRSAVEKMAASYPELDYVGDDNVVGKKIHGLYNPDIFEIEDGPNKIFKKYLSEDWSFCERWKKIGGEIFADTSIALRHIGKMPYALWNVEVSAKTVESPQNQQASLPKPQMVDTSDLKLTPVNIPVKEVEEVEEVEEVKEVEAPVPEKKAPPSIPAAGWDLINEKNKKD